ESQLDRFLMRVRMGYPSMDEEKEILRQQTHHHPLEQITPVMSGDDVLYLQEEIKNVRVDDVLLDYLMEVVAATRNSEMLDFGVSPRGSLALRRAAQAMAFTQDRSYCIADGVKRLIIPLFGPPIPLNSPYFSPHPHRTS